MCIEERRVTVDAIIHKASDFAQLDDAILNVTRINRMLKNAERSLPREVRAQTDAVSFTDVGLKLRLAAQLAVVGTRYFE